MIQVVKQDGIMPGVSTVVSMRRSNFNETLAVALTKVFTYELLAAAFIIGKGALSEAHEAKKMGRRADYFLSGIENALGLTAVWLFISKAGYLSSSGGGSGGEWNDSDFEYNSSQNTTQQGTLPGMHPENTPG